MIPFNRATFEGKELAYLAQAVADGHEIMAHGYRWETHARMGEAEERRLIEQELMRDMQARFLAAQRIAAGQQERAAASRQQQMGAMYQLGGTILGAAVGGPAGAAVGGKLGGSFGG